LSRDIIIWTPGNSRIWWACPSCKVEAGVTLPVSLSEMTKRIDKFTQDHKECASKAQEGTAWRG